MRSLKLSSLYTPEAEYIFSRVEYISYKIETVFNIVIPKYYRRTVKYSAFPSAVRFIRGCGRRGVIKDLYSLVDFFFEYPQSSPDLLLGVRFEGERGEEWRAYVERRRLSLGARMKFPRVDVGEELRGVRIRLSPAALLLPFDRYRERQRRGRLYIWR